MQSTDEAPKEGGSSDDLADDDLDLLRATAGATLTRLLEQYRYVAAPLAPDGVTFAGLVCGRDHPDMHEGCEVRGGGMVLLRVAPSDKTDDPKIFGRINTTQEPLTLADLVQHALEHEVSDHDGVEPDGA